MNNLFFGFITFFISYFIAHFICKTCGLLNTADSFKRGLKIKLILLIISLNAAAIFVINTFVSRKYVFLTQSFISGIAFYLIVLFIPFSRTKN